MDLGVQTDSQLNFHEHTTVTKKADHLVAIICFLAFEKKAFINLYKTYIWPVSEYGNVIWGP